MYLCSFGTWEKTRLFFGGGKFSLMGVESKGTFYSRIVREQGFRPGLPEVAAAAVPKFRKNILCAGGSCLGPTNPSSLQPRVYGG